jgi:hypothetical protein
MPISKPALVANNTSADPSNVGRNLQQLIAWNNAIQQHHHQQQQQHMPVDQSTNPYLAMAVLNFPHLIQQQQHHINKLNNQVINTVKSLKYNKFFKVFNVKTTTINYNFL